MPGAQTERVLVLLLPYLWATLDSPNGRKCTLVESHPFITQNPFSKPVAMLSNCLKAAISIGRRLIDRNAHNFFIAQVSVGPEEPASNNFDKPKDLRWSM